MSLMEASMELLPPGSRLDADHPENGVLIPCRITPFRRERLSAAAGHRLQADPLQRLEGQAPRVAPPSRRHAYLRWRQLRHARAQPPRLGRHEGRIGTERPADRAQRRAHLGPQPAVEAVVLLEVSDHGGDRGDAVGGRRDLSRIGRGRGEAIR
jgi:hypothetical protein